MFNYIMFSCWGLGAILWVSGQAMYFFKYPRDRVESAKHVESLPFATRLLKAAMVMVLAGGFFGLMGFVVGMSSGKR